MSVSTCFSISCVRLIIFWEKSFKWSSIWNANKKLRYPLNETALYHTKLPLHGWIHTWRQSATLMGDCVLWREPGNESIVERAWEWVYCWESLGMSLLQREPGNEALKTENEGRVWEPKYCRERLGTRLGYINDGCCAWTADMRATIESDFRNLTNEATAVYHPRTFIVQYSYSH